MSGPAIATSVTLTASLNKTNGSGYVRADSCSLGGRGVTQRTGWTVERLRSA